MNQKKDVERAASKINDFKKLKTLEFDPSQGFVCDVNTGICGPVTQEKEGK